MDFPLPHPDGLVHPILACEGNHKHAHIVGYAAGQDCHRFIAHATKIVVGCCGKQTYGDGPLAELAGLNPASLVRQATAILVAKMLKSGTVAYLLYDQTAPQSNPVDKTVDKTSLQPLSFVIYHTASFSAASGTPSRALATGAKLGTRCTSRLPLSL
jgi:hypothetical protein